MSTQQKGFTLIELLVVIAIIGVLAGVILSSLNDAREQGIAAKIQSEMNAIAKRAAIEQIQTGTYDIVCGSNGFATSSQISRLVDSINTLASSSVVCNSTTGRYAATAPVGTQYWCVDSTGAAETVSGNLNTSPPDFTCP